MVEMIPRIPYLVAFVCAIFAGGYLHELSHYFVGWIGQTEPELQWRWWIFPVGVDHGRIETMDAKWIRLSGLSILVWAPIAIVMLTEFIGGWTPPRMFLFLTPVFVVISASKSDIEAIRNPEKFRKKWMKEKYEGRVAFWPDALRF